MTLTLIINSFFEIGFNPRKSAYSQETIEVPIESLSKCLPKRTTSEFQFNQNNQYEMK
jgi:hypothetical protein